MLNAKNRPHVQRIVGATAEKFGIRIYRFANVGNHLHLMIGARRRADFQNFMREVGGRIAALVTGARKSHPGEGRFWDFLAYTRIVSWGRDFKSVETYFIKNLFEAAGLLSHKAIKAGARVVRIGRGAKPTSERQRP